MTRIASRLAAVAMLFGAVGLSPLAAAKDVLVVPEQVPYAKSAIVPPAVQNECSLPAQVSMYIRRNANAVADEVTTTPTKGAKRLEVEIADVQARGGGAWSGAKGLTLKGKLMQGNKTLGSFTARRFSGGGAFGSFKGTCAILERCAETLGRDVAVFLANPSDGIHLGD